MYAPAVPKNYLLLIASLLLFAKSYANNLQISNISLNNDSTLTFDISWENSWKISTAAPYNQDAVWTFIKYKDCATGQWQHADLSSTLGDHTAASPLEIYIDGKDAGATKGLFIRRSADGSGNISNVSVSIAMTSIPLGQYDFKVFGIEMVQITQGTFKLGDGNVSSGSFKDGSTSNPFLVDSEDAIVAGSSSGNLFTTGTAYRAVNLPAAFPKGYDEIYCMKYEISQGQYVDFVNLLTGDQASNRQVTGTSNRLTISGTWPILSASSPYRAMNFMGWADLLAYLDWSALRPMTELEYEKICRGPATPVGGEYAWGSTIITDANTITNDGSATETHNNVITAGGGVASYNNTTVLGPLRCGYAAKNATTRLEAGASYYGVMEMSGNLWEPTVSTVNSTGSAYTGIVGDGTISVSPAAGYSNVTNWPNKQASIGSTSAAVGKVQRGASWHEGHPSLRISDRGSCNTNSAQRLNEYGGRGVR
jgi:formylglycine-generating enzyme required for sulfatase activity